MESRSQQTFSEKSDTVNILGPVSHNISVTTTQFCLWSTRTAIDNSKQMDMSVLQ